MSKFFAFLRDESGATAIEYGLIAALISVVIITAVKPWAPITRPSTGRDRVK
jgi:Flp pilus assembly pilin Flp